MTPKINYSFNVCLTYSVLSLIVGAYNMGEPAPTVKKIKNMVYMSPTSDDETHPREEYLGEFFIIVFLKFISQFSVALLT